MSDPAVGARQLLHFILRQVGVQIDGGVETTLNASGLDARLLASVQSIPLQEQVGRMMRWSNSPVS